MKRALKAWIGIDPGATGSIVLLTEHNAVYAIGTNKPWVERIDFITTHAKRYEIRGIALEDVHAVYMSAAKATFTFGKNVGMMEEFCRTLQLPLIEVQPKVWQKNLIIKIPKKRSKTILKNAVAKQVCTLYPNAKRLLYTKRGRLKDGISDGLGLAHYAKYYFF